MLDKCVDLGIQVRELASVKEQLYVLTSVSVESFWWYFHF